ncbi:DNA-binding protein [Cryobacterium adonitolivorans]|uniref:DNA-binding protein n=1 Tax=Cryobacterium adonitolivorans TaxID=1259189 RepID=A0A4R8WC09_9MICO|nr:helix-hairpin-helix domain-containing protein [Cryobacterium adonitolivorans]TFC04860.1 DNA-binding protein [Cryobacterium adonitolivorans]
MARDGYGSADADRAVWVAQGIPAPARRALVAAGILTVKDLRAMDPDVLARLHGMGPSALARLRPLRATPDLPDHRCSHAAPR